MVPACPWSVLATEGLHSGTAGPGAAGPFPFRLCWQPAASPLAHAGQGGATFHRGAACSAACSGEAARMCNGCSLRARLNHPPRALPACRVRREPHPAEPPPARLRPRASSGRRQHAPGLPASFPARCGMTLPRMMGVGMPQAAVWAELW